MGNAAGKSERMNIPPLEIAISPPPKKKKNAIERIDRQYTWKREKP